MADGDKPDDDATIYLVSGIDSKKVEYDNHGQPLPIAHDACRVIKELLA